MNSETSSKAGFDPELDLLRRYEKVIETQVNTLNGIDDKAAFVARLVGILASLLVTVASYVVSTGGIEFSNRFIIVFLIFGLSISAFFLCVTFSIITYLSSRFEYGPSRKFGPFLANYKVREQQYKDVLLRGYSKAIENNKKVVLVNARRFQRSLAFFLVGLIFLFGGGLLVILNGPMYVDVAGLVILILTTKRAYVYIVEEEFLTLDREELLDD